MAAFEMEGPKVVRRAVAYPALVPGTPEWNEKRRNLIGASEVPACFGFEGGDEYRGPYALWLEKRGLMTHETREADSPAEIGRELELPIARRYKALHKDQVGQIQPAWTEHDDVLPILAATPDFDCWKEPWDENRSHAVQVKNRGGFPQGWGEKGTDLVPRPVLIQVHAELTVTQLEFIRVAALLSGNDLRIYTIYRDDTVSSEIREIVGAWHKKHIEGGVEPKIAGPGVTSYFAGKFPKATAELTVQATEGAQVEALRECGLAVVDKKKAEARYEDAQAVLMKMIGDNYGIEERKAGKAIWYNSPGRKSITESALREHLNTLALSGVLTVPVDAVIAAVTKVGEAYRTFRYFPGK